MPTDSTPHPLLGTTLLTVLRDVRKGREFASLIAVAGSQASVLVSRKAIGPGQRKLLAADLGVSTGIKYLPATCLFENKALTFVLETWPGGLVKRLTAALLRQTEQRFKVRVRGADPVDVEEDGSDDEKDGQPGNAGAAAPSPAPSAGAAADRQSAAAEHVATAKACMRTWMQARDKAGRAIGQLEPAVRQVTDRQLQAAVLRNMQAVNRQLSGSMTKQLADFARSEAAPAAARQALRRQIGTARRNWAASKPLQMLDRNPFGVRLNLRAEVDGALKQIEDLLQRSGA